MTLLYKDKTLIRLLILFLAIILGLGIINLYFFLKKHDRLSYLLNRASPAKINIVKITDKNCLDCFDLERIIGQLRKTSVKIKREEALDRQDTKAQKIISQYNISRLPVFLVTGDLDKNNELIRFWKIFGEKRDDGKTFLLTKVFPPYVEAASGEVRGRFSLIYLTDVSCDECYDVTKHEIALSNLGLPVRAENSRVVDIKTAESEELISRYKIEHVPTIILRGDLTVYDALTHVWKSVGTIEEDGAYVFREEGEKIMGKYKNLKTGKVTD